MARVPNRFYDASDDAEYLWPINHLQEEEGGTTTSVARSAPTSGIGVVRQQGEETPLKFTFQGTILDPAQHEAFVEWRERCRTHTVQFRDFAGEEYEVLITSYRPRREWVAHNPRGGTTARNHIWRYTLEMDVIQVLSGAWA